MLCKCFNLQCGATRINSDSFCTKREETSLIPFLRCFNISFSFSSQLFKLKSEEYLYNVYIIGGNDNFGMEIFLIF